MSKIIYIDDNGNQLQTVIESTDAIISEGLDFATQIAFEAFIRSIELTLKERQKQA